MIFTGLPDGTYTLKEVTPPTDYEKCNDVIFTISKGQLVADSISWKQMGTGKVPVVIAIDDKVNTGNLSIKKVVNGEGKPAISDLEFEINVALSGYNWSPYTIAYSNGKTTTNNSDNIQLKLKDGESVEIQGIPEGVTYTVTESTFSGEEYSRYSFGSITGDVDKAIADATTNSVVVNNNYSAPEVGKIQITKTIEGDVTDEDLSGLKFTVYAVNPNDRDNDELIAEHYLNEFTKDIHMSSIMLIQQRHIMLLKPLQH